MSGTPTGPVGPLDGALDEALTPDGVDRPHARPALAAVRRAGPGALAAAVAADAAAVPLLHGVEDEEHVLHLDPVPRVLRADEFDLLARGLRQRVQALEAFVADVHGSRESVRAGVVPAELVETNHYVAPREVPVPRRWIGMYGPDVVRGADGDLVVLEDNVRTPTLLAYALQARRLVGERLTAEHGVTPTPRPVHGAAQAAIRAMLQSASPVADPVVAVLGDGARSAVTWEIDRLAALAGAPVVEAHHARVEDDRLLLPDGRAVDVLWRRTSEERLLGDDGQPNELGTLLLGPLRAGSLAVVNAFGTGVADDKRTHAYVEDLVRFFTGQEPLVRSQPTFDLGDPEQRDAALPRLEQLVLKPRSGSGGHGVLVGPRATEEQLAQRRAMVEADPAGWVAQEPVAISTHPTVVDGVLAPRHVDLRPFVFCTGDRAGDRTEDTVVLPGGLTRVALTEGDLVVNVSQGGGGKDTWVL